MNEENVMPVYLFIGFLEGGKTKFIQETLESDNFNNGDRTLLLVCEEGIEEYDEDKFDELNVVMHTIEDMSELEPTALDKIVRESGCKRIVLEYNGMWTINDLFQNTPDDWMIYQIMMFVDSSTFLSYNQNMRQLVVDKLNMCELVVFNRFDKEKLDKMEFHKIVRGVDRRTQIAYEYTDGTGEYDDIEDPLPFDIEADPIIVDDRDYALWYRDICEEPDKYEGKTVQIKVSAVRERGFPKGIIALGRQVMTCCIEDIRFCWLVSECSDTNGLDLSSPKGVNATFRVKIRNHKMYRGRGPILCVQSLEPAKAPDQEVATFY